MPETPTLPNFNRHPMLWLAVAFAAGILADNLQHIDIRVSVAAGAIFACAALISRSRDFAAILMLVAFAAAGGASLQIQEDAVSPDRLRVFFDNGTIRSGDPIEVEGVLLGRPEQSVDGAFLNLRAERVKYRGSERTVSGNVRLFLPTGADDIDQSGLGSANLGLKYGSRIRTACRISREDEFLDPGVIPKKEMLDRLGVDATGSIKSPMLVEKLADESVFLPLAWVYDQREQLITDFENNLGRSAAGIMIASLLGDKYFLDKDTADLFREGGTFHILVISGLHITFIGGLLLLFLRQVTRNRWTQFVVTMAVLWGYTLAVGADVPVVRAAVMFTIVLYSYVIYRQGSLLNSLGTCGLILLVWRPTDLFNPSFQLTFVSVAAIVACAYPLIDTFRQIGSWEPTVRHPFPPNVPERLRRFCETLYWREEVWDIRAKRQIWTARLFKSPYLSDRVAGTVQKAVRFVFEGLLVSLIVQIWMLPLLVVYFHRVSGASVLLNLWVGLFIAIESFAAVLGVLLGHISGLLAAPFFTFAEIVNWLMLSVPRLFADNGWASFRLPAYSGYGRAIYSLYFLPILFLAFALNRWDPFSLRPRGSITRPRYVYLSAAALTALILITVTHPFSAPRPDGRLHFDFLDVGQGDAALVTFPDGETLLVDGGGRFDFQTAQSRGGDESEPFEPDVRGIGEAVVSEFLWDRGYSRIDHILATHADADHIQGLSDVARNFSVGTAAFGRTPASDPNFARLADVLRRRGIPVEVIARGEGMKFGEVKVEVLYPIASKDPNGVSDNDHSVVLRFIYGSRAFLLTGDIEGAAETALVSSGTALAADLIKVPHHGSRTSSTPEFINSVGAKYAVVSVGRSSPFGHPHPDVIERWLASGASVMITGQTGMISVSTDGRDLDVKTLVQ